MPSDTGDRIFVGGELVVMGISIPAELESELRARADAEGISVEVYLERLVRADTKAVDELARLAHDGIASGDPIEPAADYWPEKHRRLDQQMKSRSVRATYPSKSRSGP